MQELSVGVKGFNIRYKESGREHAVSTTKRHILFIHGIGSSSDRWLDIPDALARYFHTVSVDLIGFGGSDKPATMDYTIKNLAEFILEFMDKVKIDDGRTAIVGHSLGGYIAAEVAMQKRDTLERLVLIDSSGMLEKPTPLLEEYLDAALSPSYEKVKKVFEQMTSYPFAILPILIELFIKRMESPGAKHAFKSAFLDSTRNRIDLARLNSIGDMPALILWGSDDRVIPVEHSKLFKQVFRNAPVEIIENGGHAPFAEKPALVCEILHSFMT
jgi:2-hydroxy-6-oxonona-2,4-dienedioate hydrolase